MGTQTTEPAKLPPAWCKHAFWRVHRSLYRLIGGRVLWTPKSKRGWGAMHLTTMGRKSGEQRSVIVGYVEDGSTPVVLAMNGWDEGQPAWWLNLEAHPDAVIRLKGQPERQVRARRVDGDERDRLWRLWAEIDEGLDAYADSRSADTPVVRFEPCDAATHHEPCEERRTGRRVERTGVLGALRPRSRTGRGSSRNPGPDEPRT